MIDHESRLRAKDISIIDYLNKKGCRHSKSSGNYEFYYSPWRSESDGSLCVSKKTNRWVDWGETKDFRGDVIDLVQKMENIDGYNDAIDFLLSGDIKRGSYDVGTKPKRDSVIIRDKLPIKSETLIDYLKNKRGIDIDLARMYCKELHVVFPHKHPTRQHKFIAFENKKGGWELRNEYLKIGNSPKYYSIIPGGAKVIIFEGFIDFLTSLMYYKVDRFKADVIVLNSVNMIAYAEPRIKKASEVYSFGDNDNAGNELVKHLGELNNNVVDMRSVYYTYKDFNQYWMSVRKEIEFLDSVV